MQPEPKGIRVGAVLLGSLNSKAVLPVLGLTRNMFHALQKYVPAYGHHADVNPDEYNNVRIPSPNILIHVSCLLLLVGVLGVEKVVGIRSNLAIRLKEL